ncbi:MAG: MscL family protein [Candidatus Sulfotelmatobacter sp.]|jgi:large-conductance mechanosensitive channel
MPASRSFLVEQSVRTEYSYHAVDDTPKAFLEEFRSTILKKRVGQIALAVVLAEAVWRLVNSMTWYLIIPLTGRAFQGHTESVLFESATTRPVPWENLFGSIMEFVLTLIVVFYLNRWVQRKPATRPATHAEMEYNSVGQPLAADDAATPMDREPESTHSD